MEGISFFYLNKNSTDYYRKRVNEYLDEKEREFDEKGGLGVIVSAHNNLGDTHGKYSLNGHLYLQKISEDFNEEFEKVCNYVLSRDRKFIPKAVKCATDKDYSMIEDILKKNQGECAGLKNNFWEFGKTIKTK